MVSSQDSRLWQHWSIEKNLISVDDEILNYSYVPPPAYKNSLNVMQIIFIGISISGIAIALLSIGIKPKKK